MGEGRIDKNSLEHSRDTNEIDNVCLGNGATEGSKPLTNGQFLPDISRA
jgi:hypothetical protein